MATTPPCDSDIYGRLVRARRVWAVGAIHGDAHRVVALHSRLAPRLAAGDRLVYLGNYLGYGPAPASTLDALILFRRLFLARRNAFLGDIVFLRGSQEEIWQKLLELQFAPDPRELLPWMLEHGVERDAGFLRHRFRGRASRRAARGCWRSRAGPPQFAPRSTHARAIVPS